ncbi:MAG: peptidoglycan-associated lipoprotein Pal [Proteobacteria bacterium]|nr:peptidoglycan-associated lipoprotein Pal [Pseudomonadota bacterium]
MRRLTFFLVIVVLVLLTAACGVKKRGVPTVEPCGVSTDTDVALSQAEQDRLAAERDALRAKEMAERDAMSAKQREMMQAQYRQAMGAFTTMIYYAFDSADLSSEAQRILREKADFLKKYPDTRIVIEGHCDERGSNEYNLALGERRAESAKKFLVDLGVASSRMSTISYGEEKPAAMGHGEDAWSLNRRSEFAVE